MHIVHFLDSGLGRRIGLQRDDGGVVDLRGLERHRRLAEGYAGEHAESAALRVVPADFGEFVSNLDQNPHVLDVTLEYLGGCNEGAIDELRERGIVHQPDAVTYLPPIGVSSNIICIGRNYTEHLKETGREIPENPSLFLRTHGSVTGHREEIVRPSVSIHLDWEGELALVVGKPGRYIKEEESLDYLAGYATFNDGSIRDYQTSAPTPTAGKNFHHTGSCGPWFVTKDEIKDPQNLAIKTWIDDEIVQDGNTEGMVVGIAKLVAYISEFIYLQPGDLIATGTPSGVGYTRTPPRFLLPGQELRIEVEGVGELVNTVVDEA